MRAKIAKKTRRADYCPAFYLKFVCRCGNPHIFIIMPEKKGPCFQSPNNPYSTLWSKMTQISFHVFQLRAVATFVQSSASNWLCHSPISDGLTEHTTTGQEVTGRDVTTYQERL